MHPSTSRIRQAALDTLRVIACGAAFALPAHALEFSTSGFATLAVGKTSGSCVPSGLVAPISDECTRYIADWSHNGIYDNSWSARPETRLGLQSTARFTSQFSATGQVVSRLLPDQHANLEWLYLTYQPTPEWTIQLGRKRLPLYYYSDFQDVGYAYNLVRPSPDVYGWDVVNYNGLSVSRTVSIGDWSVRTEVLAGPERSKENKMYQVFFLTPQEVEWRDIAGVNTEFSRDWFTGRLSYTQFRYKDTDVASGTTIVDGGPRHRMLGLTLNADIGNWIVRSEFGSAKRPSFNLDARFYLANLGHRVGDFTFTGGTSWYDERFYDTGDLNNRHRVLTGAVRYEVHKGGALKFQFDRLREQTGEIGPMLGNARVITATYDVAF
jgi:hypothetical protein